MYFFLLTSQRERVVLPFFFFSFSSPSQGLRRKMFYSRWNFFSHWIIWVFASTFSFSCCCKISFKRFRWFASLSKSLTLFFWRDFCRAAPPRACRCRGSSSRSRFPDKHLTQMFSVAWVLCCYCCHCIVSTLPSKAHQIKSTFPHVNPEGWS